MAQRSTFTISELAEAAGATPRTVRYYTAEGLLPPPDARGRYATYSSEHLDRLFLIDRLKEARLPLTAIRDRLSGLTAEEVRSFVADSNFLPEEWLVDELLIKCAEATRARTDAAEASARNRPDDSYTSGVMDAPSVAAVMDKPLEPELVREADTWRRIMLAPGVELNVRASITPDSAKRIDELVRAAKDLFDTGI